MVIDKAVVVDPDIERLRTRLHHALVKHGDLLHPEVLRISQELDHHLVHYLQKQLHLTRRPPQDTNSRSR